MSSEMDFDGGSAPPAEQKPIPAEGLHDAVCYAVVNWGDVLSDFPGSDPEVHQAVRFFFELDEKMADGRPFVLSTYPVTIKYGERAKFRTLMKSWLGAKECPEKLVGFPLGTMKGRMASLNVEHKLKDDGTFSARIKDVLKARPGAAPLVIVNTSLPEWVKQAKEKDNAAAARFRAHAGQRTADASESDPPYQHDEVPF